MTKITTVASAALMMSVAQSLAGQDVAAIVARAMPRPYTAPTCDISSGHFKVSSAATYLVVASGGNRNVEGTSDPEKIASQLASGIRVATEAITQNDQGSNGAAWYYLGRLYIMGGDLVGADSAFTRAARLLPACGEDMKAWRQIAWMPLSNRANELMRPLRGDSASLPNAAEITAARADMALALFRQAAVISSTLPTGFNSLGVLFANKGQDDSAAVYFKKAQEVASADRRFEKDRNAATFNLAAMYQRSGKNELAIIELRRYIDWDPTDVDARRALASLLRKVGQNAAADSADRAVLTAAQQTGTVTSGDIMTIGINFFNEKKFPEAAAEFEKLLVDEPFNRDVLFNLANTFYAMGDGAKLEPIAVRLVAIEPLGEDSRKLLSNSYRLQNNQEKLLVAVTELFQMPTAITVTGLTTRAGGATLRGEAFGRQAQTVDGKEVPPAPRTIVVEFLSAKGDVVASTEVAIPALQPAVKHDVSAEGSGAGIVGWRYRVK